MTAIKPPTLEEFNASCRPDEIVRAPTYKIERTRVCEKTRRFWVDVVINGKIEE